MKPTEEQIETALRNAPRPATPAGLRSRLVDQINLAGAGQTQVAPDQPGPGWLQRWWPALAACAVAVASLVVLAVQRTEIAALRQQLDVLKQAAAAPAPGVGDPALPASASSAVSTPDADKEIESLQATAQALRAEVARLEAMKAENARLNTAAATQLGLSSEQMEQLKDARDKAQLIQCVNNLKQLGLAGRMWSADNGDVLPPDFLSMSNYMGTPKILICPSDTGRQPAADWSSFSLANVSYESLAPGGPDTEPQRVMFRCPIHGNVTLCDGSVQQRVAKDHPERLIQRGGKLFLEDPPSAQVVQPGQMDPRMAARYGLAPAVGQAGVAAGQDHLIQVEKPWSPPNQQPQMDEQLMRRYGLVPAGAGTDHPTATEDSGAEAEPTHEPEP
jgi:hypothetical protein